MMVLSLSIGMTAALAAPRAQDTPTPGGTLRISIGEDPDQLDPGRTIELTAAQVNANIYDALVYYSSDGLPHGQVAESWDISTDGLTITVTIRQGLKFHDGTALDAAAVKFGYDRIMDPATASPALAFLGPIKSVDAPDATTVMFTYNQPYAAFFYAAATIGIVSPAAVQKEGDNFGHNPVGSGPFMFKSWEAGTKIVFVRNPDYVNVREDDNNKGAAYVDELDINIIGEPATRTAAFESGELDVVGVDTSQLTEVSSLPGVTIVDQEKGHSINFIEFSNKAPFNNEHFRKAIAYAIDTDSVVEIAYQGRGTKIQCPVGIGETAYNADLCAQHGYTFDLDKAKAELAAGGFTDSDGNGIVEMDGKDIEVTLWSYTGFEVQEKTLQVVQPDLNKIGLKVDIQAVDFGALQPKLEAGETGMDYMRWTWYDQSILSQMLKSPGWVKQSNDPDLDKLIAVADTTVDPQARLQASYAVEAYVLDHAIIVPMLTDWFQSGIHENVHDYHWDVFDTPQYVDVWLNS